MESMTDNATTELLIDDAMNGRKDGSADLFIFLSFGLWDFWMIEY